MFSGGNQPTRETGKQASIKPRQNYASNGQTMQIYQKYKVGEDQNSIIRLASNISHNDLDFISTLEAENGLWKIDRKSRPNSDGTRDYGLCQLNSAYHKSFIQSRDFKQTPLQIKYCLAIFKQRPTAFYGYYHRNEMKSKFYLVQSHL